MDALSLTISADRVPEIAGVPEGSTVPKECLAQEQILALPNLIEPESRDRAS
jgi:hypothetical protein